MRRFFFDPTGRDGDRVFLSAEESHHITKVLRLKSGDMIEVLDGLGAVFQAVITSVGRQVEAQIEEIMAREVGNGKPIRVWQAILKGDKMDLGGAKMYRAWRERAYPLSEFQMSGQTGYHTKRQETSAMAAYRP